MPYDTRRKSLSLPSLGIHVPSSNPRTNKSPANHSSTTPSTMSPKSRRSLSSVSEDDNSRPSKKAKKSHGQDASKPATSKASKPAKNETTPPPSPGLHMSIELDDTESSGVADTKKVDLEGIHDEIVEAVIVRLQESRNRPHLVKDLATVLVDQVKIVQQSANPCAIISSRLSGYLRRSCWSALAPCPLAKELETVHPRRTYFYLTTCPHQPLPDPSSVQRSMATPELSSSTSTTEDAESADNDRRRELSLSPEVDLSSPEFDEMDEDVQMPGTPIGSVSLSGRPRVSSMSRNQKDEPPLEKDEREFTQTADGLQKRKLSGSLLSVNPVENMDVYDGMQNDALFGEPRGLNLAPGLLPHMAYMTSPAMRPSFAMPPKKDGEAEGWSKLDAMLDWDRSPETIELDELDCLLNDY
ncbi:hypothetical protein JX265_001281 [Neoarthrinium moseri]|uniref:GDS1 winged helix domain-containing protein n=1 Tax=Neoarthrinium moseri TaxID=1658444 RepID=A0A9P9WXH3_9PEZI|nr:uncharacterized protein JN550_010731 [Neoarthrinium moseri]KAI1848949.1 hypothetical protein JX266_005377 [Neoarthrinium moseri]KAI1861661.1 hypothetical protein JN550_010731 [Neoarthrinium moseri]KAI1881041.1 hypothetical protein JX265_001281 [Neoarthrinium moseri]